MTIQSDLLDACLWLGAGVDDPGKYVDAMGRGHGTYPIPGDVLSIAGPTGTPAIKGSGAANQEVTVANTAAAGLKLTAVRAWSFWVRVDTSKTTAGIFSHGNWTHNAGWYFYLSNLAIAFGIHRWLLTTSGGNLTAGAWHHFVVNLPASGNPTGYRDGSPITFTTASSSRPATLVDATVAAKVLDEEGATGRNLIGAVAEPATFSRELTQTEAEWLSDPENSLLMREGPLFTRPHEPSTIAAVKAAAPHGGPNYRHRSDTELVYTGPTLYPANPAHFSGVSVSGFFRTNAYNASDPGGAYEIIAREPGSWALWWDRTAWALEFAVEYQWTDAYNTVTDHTVQLWSPWLGNIPRLFNPVWIFFWAGFKPSTEPDEFNNGSSLIFDENGFFEFTDMALYWSVGGVGNLVSTSLDPASQYKSATKLEVGGVSHPGAGIPRVRELRFNTGPTVTIEWLEDEAQGLRHHYTARPPWLSATPIAPAAYYRFRGGLPARLRDSSGNNRHLTLA